MGFYERKYFTDEPEYYLCEQSEKIKEDLVKKYIENVENNPNFDDGFKKYVKDKNNIKVDTQWGYVAHIKCRSLDVDVHYRSSVSVTTGYSGKIEGEHVSISRNLSSSSYDSHITEGFSRYMIVSSLIDSNEYVVNTKYGVGDRIEKAKRIQKIPDFINNKQDFTSNSFIRFAYRNSDTSDIEMEVANDKFRANDTILGVSFESCYADSIAVYFVPIYSITVKYKDDTYNLSNLLGVKDVKDDNYIGKLSREYIGREKIKKRINKFFGTVTFLTIISCIVLFIILCANADKVNLNEFEDPVVIFIGIRNLGPVMFFASIGICLVSFIPFGCSQPKSKIVAGVVTTIIDIAYIVFYILAIITVKGMLG